MKLAILSDLHLLHWSVSDLGTANLGLLYQFMGDHKVDVLVDAGDTERPDLVAQVCEILRVEYVRTNGNHDYYGVHWTPLMAREGSVRVVGGIAFICTPFWTNLNDNDQDTHYAVTDGLIDCRAIHNFSTGRMLEAHEQQRQFIETALKTLGPSSRNVVVTHHAPSFRSVHPRWSGTLVNYGFASKLDDFVASAGAELWVHGHVHDSFDYVIGETRVICQPCGYPGERGQLVEPVIIDV